MSQSDNPDIAAIGMLMRTVQAEDKGLTGRLLVLTREYAKKQGYEVSDITPGCTGKSDPFHGLKKGKAIRFLARTPNSEELFAQHTPPPINQGKVSVVFMPAVAFLFRVDSASQPRYMGIPSESAFSQHEFDAFVGS